MKKPEQSCLLCGSSSWRAYADFNPYFIWRCLHCQLLVLAPRPSADELQKLYQADYFTEHLQDQMPDTNSGQSAQITLRSHFVDWLQRSINRKSGRMLEVGCATGFLLKAFAQVGWNTFGIEFSADASTYARQTLHLDVYTGSVSREPLAGREFDAIVMLHTLEHVPDPLQVCTILRDHLAPDGFLVIQVPNSRGLQARFQGKNWEGWRIPYHFFHFSPQTLRRLLQKSGFRVIKCEYSLPDFETNLLRKFSPQDAKSAARQEMQTVSKKKSRSLRKVLLDWHKKLPFGRDITVIAVKE
jgi:SAM-dependent methyltransferase